ncbi:phospholipid carrier-dependent glycosyltransferase [Acidobacteria bacterium AB60]|nr:phospholipid carrier-dependent glycosyltransferase [Acidobacteria bacterium AB60]
MNTASQSNWATAAPKSGFIRKVVPVSHSLKRWGAVLWVTLIVGFAAAHLMHLQADFPNQSPWSSDWAKYTDEGWYGNAAIRARLFGHWYLPGDFNPAPAVPVWPALEWLLFGVTGVSVTAARALAGCFFLTDMALAYLLVRMQHSRWAAALAVTLAVTSPFLYSFSRLAILEPMLVCFLLTALNLAIRLPRMKHPVLMSSLIGLLYTLMLLTKTSAAFLLPALAWAMLQSLRNQGILRWKCTASAALASAMSFAGWMAFVVHAQMLKDYRYLFYINKYPKPHAWYWPAVSFWWSLHGVLWADRILLPLTGILIIVLVMAWPTEWSRQLRQDPVFGASFLSAAGYIFFMTYQNHPQPRYYTVVALFSFLVLALGVEKLLNSRGAQAANHLSLRESRRHIADASGGGWALLLALVVAVGVNAAWTYEYAARPQYTLLEAAQQLTRYIDQHPNGNRMLLSISGDEITLLTHLPTLCDDFGTVDLPTKLAQYEPGWWATWNDIDPGTLEDLHVHHSLEQVASFHAMDDPERNVLVLFKLHRLPEPREIEGANLQQPLPGDRIDIPVQ